MTGRKMPKGEEKKGIKKRLSTEKNPQIISSLLEGLGALQGGRQGFVCMYCM